MPEYSRCSVSTCNNTNNNTDKSVIFHKLPTDPETRKIWIERCQDSSERKHLLVCSKHFQESDYRFRITASDVFPESRSRNLKAKAVPTLFLPGIGEKNPPKQSEIINKNSPKKTVSEQGPMTRVRVKKSKFLELRANNKEAEIRLKLLKSLSTKLLMANSKVYAQGEFARKLLGHFTERQIAIMWNGQNKLQLKREDYIFGALAKKCLPNRPSYKYFDSELGIHIPSVQCMDSWGQTNCIVCMRKKQNGGDCSYCKTTAEEGSEADPAVSLKEFLKEKQAKFNLDYQGIVLPVEERFKKDIEHLKKEALSRLPNIPHIKPKPGRPKGSSKNKSPKKERVSSAKKTVRKKLKTVEPASDDNDMDTFNDAPFDSDCIKSSGKPPVQSKKDVSVKSLAVQKTGAKRKEAASVTKKKVGEKLFPYLSEVVSVSQKPMKPVSDDHINTFNDCNDSAEKPPVQSKKDANMESLTVQITETKQKEEASVTKKNVEEKLFPYLNEIFSDNMGRVSKPKTRRKRKYSKIPKEEVGDKLNEAKKPKNASEKKVQAAPYVVHNTGSSNIAAKPLLMQPQQQTVFLVLDESHGIKEVSALLTNLESLDASLKRPDKTEPTEHKGLDIKIQNTYSLSDEVGAVFNKDHNDQSYDSEMTIPVSSPVSVQENASSPIDTAPSPPCDEDTSSPLCEDDTPSSPLCEDDSPSSPSCNDTPSSPLCEDDTPPSPLCDDESASSPLCDDESASSPLCDDDSASSLCDDDPVPSPLCDDDSVPSSESKQQSPEETGDDEAVNLVRYCINEGEEEPIYVYMPAEQVSKLQNKQIVLGQSDEVSFEELSSGQSKKEDKSRPAAATGQKCTPKKKKARSSGQAKSSKVCKKQKLPDLDNCRDSATKLDTSDDDKRESAQFKTENMLTSSNSPDNTESAKENSDSTYSFKKFSRRKYGRGQGRPPKLPSEKVSYHPYELRIAEKYRRDILRGGFDMLQNLIPSICDKKVLGKYKILDAAASDIESLKREEREYEQERERLLKERAAIQRKIEKLKSEQDVQNSLDHNSSKSTDSDELRGS